jgi:hypothetical protein
MQHIKMTTDYIMITKKNTMIKPFQHLLTFSTIMCSLTVLGQTHTQSENCTLDSTVINGTYKGKNLYFTNTTPNGIQFIAVDNQKVLTDFESTFEMEFSKFNINTGQAFELKIIYCRANPIPYKILNPEVIN